MRARRGAAVILGAFALLALLTSGCSAVSNLVNTENALRDAGYQSVNVNSTFSGSTSTVKASVHVDAPPTVGTANDVARIVWREFHERFDYLQVTVHGTGLSATQQYSFEQVQSMFGPRDPAWNKTSVRSAYTHVGLEIVGGLVVLAAVIILIAVLATRRSRRNRAAWAAGGWGAGWPGPGWPPYGPGGPGPYAGPAPGRWAPGPGGPPAPGGWAPGPAGPPVQGGAPPGGAPGPPPPPGAGGGGYPMWPAPPGPPRPPAGAEGDDSPRPEPHEP